MRRKFLLALGGVMVVDGAAFAVIPTGTTLSTDGTIAYANHVAYTFTAPLTRPAKRTAIYDNFAGRDPKGLYMAGIGATMGGPKSLVGQRWIAAAFTPAASASVTEIQVPIGYLEGRWSDILISLYSDAAGIPGTLLWSHKADFPLFGNCCSVASARDTAGAPVTAGTQYWVAVTTLPRGDDTTVAWSFNVADQIDAGSTAENRGAGWVAGTSLPNVAFAVYGK